MTLHVTGSLRRTPGLVAVVLVAAAAGLVGLATAPPAAAAACTSTTGVTVLADFEQLGGGVPTTCVADGGGKAASTLFESAGLPLTYAQRQPGFVCQVSGQPAGDPCVNASPADAYWGLWWSNGDPGSTWTYSSLGVTSLKVPAGGLVAFAWDQVEGDAVPAASASRPAAASSPSPTPVPPASAPTTAPSSGSGSGGSGSGGSGGSGSTISPPGSTSSPAPDSSVATAPGSAQAEQSEQTDETEQADPGGSSAGTNERERRQQARGDRQRDRATNASSDDPGTEPAGDADDTDIPSAEATTDDAVLAASETAPVGDEGLPVWVAPALIVLLLAGSGSAWWWRRRVVEQP